MSPLRPPFEGPDLRLRAVEIFLALPKPPLESFASSLGKLGGGERPETRVVSAPSLGAILRRHHHAYEQACQEATSEQEACALSHAGMVSPRPRARHDRSGVTKLHVSNIAGRLAIVTPWRSVDGSERDGTRRSA